jgi:hypothetical protein
VIGQCYNVHGIVSTVEAIYSTIPWSHQNDTLTDKVWYVSNISWCTYLEDNYIVFENITASNYSCTAKIMEVIICWKFYHGLAAC